MNLDEMYLITYNLEELPRFIIVGQDKGNILIVYSRSAPLLSPRHNLNTIVFI